MLHLTPEDLIGQFALIFDVAQGDCGLLLGGEHFEERPQLQVDVEGDVVVHLVARPVLLPLLDLAQHLPHVLARLHVRDHVQAVNACEAAGGHALSSQSPPCLEALRFSRRSFDLRERFGRGDQREEVVHLAVGRHDCMPSCALKIALPNWSLHLLGPDQRLPESIDLGIAEGHHLLRPRAIVLLVAAVLLQGPFVLEVPPRAIVVMSPSSTTDLPLYVCDPRLRIVDPLGDALPCVVRLLREVEQPAG